MGWDGSGNFIRDNGANTGASVWTDDRDAATKILASYHDIHDEGIATGLENCVTRDGQNSPSQNLPMNTKRHTNVGAGVALTDYARMDQIQKSSGLYGTSGTSTAYLATMTPNPLAYSAGLAIRVQFHTSCGNNPTLNVNGLGAQSIFVSPGSNAKANRLLSNHYYDLVHDGSTGWNIVNVTPNATTWSPSYSASGSMAIGSVATDFASYVDKGATIEVGISFAGTTSGVADNIIGFTLPVPSLGYCALSCVARNGSGSAQGGICYVSGSNAFVSLSPAANWGIGVGRGAWITGIYFRA